MSKKHLLGLLAMSLAMSTITGIDRESQIEKAPGKSLKNPGEKPIPKGCKKYYFTQDGWFTNSCEQDEVDDYIFNCIASSDKVAKKKFNKFKNK